MVADTQKYAGLALVKDIDPSDKLVSFAHCDVTKESDVDNAVNTIVTKHGKLDIMFANAGISGIKTYSILQEESDNLKNLLGVHVFGSFSCAKYAAKVMIPAKAGSIIFNAMAGTLTFGDAPHGFTASKMATVGLAKNLGVESGQYGIRVNCVSPYGVSTSIARNALGMSKEKLDEIFEEGANLKGVLLEEDDVANAVLYLGSDESKYVSGLNLAVDGGYSIANVALSHAFKKYKS